MKRGQVTVFIIIGILVVIAVSLTLYVQRETVKDFFEERISRLSKLPQEIQPVEIHIKSCIEDTSRISLNLIFMQGGYFENNKFIEMGNFDTAYWYDKKDMSPSLGIIEEEIAKSVNYLLPSCILDFEEDYEIEIKKISSNIKIKNEKVISEAEVILNAKYKDLTYSLDDNYKISFESEAKGIYDSAKIILDSQKEDFEGMDLTLLSRLPYTINFFRFENTIVYAVSDKEPVLMFANKF